MNIIKQFVLCKYLGDNGERQDEDRFVSIIYAKTTCNAYGGSSKFIFQITFLFNNIVFAASLLSK